MITDIQQPIVIIAEEGRSAEVVTRLARVGYDNALGYLEGGVEAWKAAGKETDHIEAITADELAKKVAAGLDGEIMDVRKPTEFLSQHVIGAINFPLDYINKNMNKLQRNEKLYLHCAGGYRSLIAASILKARGIHNLVDVENGWKAIAESTLPKTEHVCPTTMPQDLIDKAVEAVAH